MFGFKERMERLQKKMRVDCIVLAQFSPAEGTAYSCSGSEEPFRAYVPRDYSVAFTAENLREKSVPQFDETMPLKNAKNFWKKLFKKRKVESVGLDFSTDASRVGFRLLKEKARLHVENYAAELEGLRALKDAQEKKLIRKAQKITKECVREAEERGFGGRSENEIAGFLEYACRKKGFALDSFPPIVATAPKNAIPHAIPSQDKCKDMILIDCGATCAHYHGDYSTTKHWGKSKEIKDAVEAVREAKKAAERIAKPGVHGKKLAHAAEKVINEYGFGKHSFKKTGLALGHSLGLNVHDGFRLEDVTLAKGIVFTIEPGIYVPKRFGVRFEDVVFP